MQPQETFVAPGNIAATPKMRCLTHIPKTMTSVCWEQPANTDQVFVWDADAALVVSGVMMPKLQMLHALWLHTVADGSLTSMGYAM